VAATKEIPRVWLEWQALPYHGFTACATCGEFRNCCGVNTESRVCINCFEFEHDEKAPNYRRRKNR
jgi:hypothetical protein